MVKPVTLTPKAAAEMICHDEQMVIWSGDLVGALSLGGFLRDLDYSEGVDLHAVVTRELRSIIGMALDHPEARTVINRTPIHHAREPAKVLPIPSDTGGEE